MTRFHSSRLAPPEPGSPPRVLQRGGVVEAAQEDAALARRSRTAKCQASEAKPR